MLRIGIDLGGTKIEIIALDEDGRTLARRRVATPQGDYGATVAAVEKVMPSVVNIGTLTVARADPYEQMLREFFGYGNRAPDTLYSSGSGVIIDDEGWVLTNFHVVRESAKVQVTLADTTEPIDAEVVEIIYMGDILRAVLRVAGTDNFVMKMRNTLGQTKLSPGQKIKVGWHPQDARALDP